MNRDGGGGGGRGRRRGLGAEGRLDRDAVYIYIYIITVARFKDVYYFSPSAGYARLKTVHVHLRDKSKVRGDF